MDGMHREQPQSPGTAPQVGVDVESEVGDIQLRATGSTVAFPGFLAVWGGGDGGGAGGGGGGGSDVSEDGVGAAGDDASSGASGSGGGSTAATAAVINSLKACMRLLLSFQ